MEGEQCRNKNKVLSGRIFRPARKMTRVYRDRGVRAIDIPIPSTIDRRRKGRKKGTNHASGKMGNDEFLAGVRTRFFCEEEEARAREKQR